MNLTFDKFATKQIERTMHEGYMDKETADVFKSWLEPVEVSIFLSNRDSKTGEPLASGHLFSVYFGGDGLFEGSVNNQTLSEIVDEELDSNMCNDGMLSEDTLSAFARLAGDFEREAEKIRAAIKKSEPNPDAVIPA